MNEGFEKFDGLQVCYWIFGGKDKRIETEVIEIFPATDPDATDKAMRLHNELIKKEVLSIWADADMSTPRKLLDMYEKLIHHSNKIPVILKWYVVPPGSK